MVFGTEPAAPTTTTRTLKLTGKSFDNSKNYSVLTALGSDSPASSVKVGYMYYIANSVESSTTMQLTQQGTAANSVALTSMWLMEESADGAYTTLDGRKWSKVFEYSF